MLVTKLWIYGRKLKPSDKIKYFNEKLVSMFVICRIKMFQSKLLQALYSVYTIVKLKPRATNTV